MAEGFPVWSRVWSGVAAAGRRRGAGLAVAAAAVAVLSGCAAVPSKGSVHLGREVPPVGTVDVSDIRVLPPAPAPGESAAAIVRGFLEALGNSEDDHAIAREYLTPQAAPTWSTGTGVVVYNATGLRVTTAAGTAHVRAPRLAEVLPDGTYRLAAGTLDLRLALTRVDGQWRIAAPPDRLVLSVVDFLRAFRAVDVYFLDRSWHTLVPERLFVDVPGAALSTALARALVSGPGAWLAPAVRTALPPGTALVGNVPVVNGVAQVDLSRDVLRASPDRRRALAAQLVWTLGQLPDVSAVRLSADGAPVAVDGSTQPEPLDAWPTYTPDVLGPDSGFVYVASGAVRGGGGLALVPSGWGSGTVDPALAPGGDRLAAVRTLADGAVLLAGRPGSAPVALRWALRFTPPSVDSLGEVWTAATDVGGGQRVLVATADDAVHAVGTPGRPAGEARALRVSREGSRVAAVVGGRLFLARVEAGAQGWALSGWQPLLPGGTGPVLGVAWQDAEHVLVTVESGGGVQPLVVTDDGSAAVPATSAVVPGGAATVTAAPGAPLLASWGGAVWLSWSGPWHRLVPGVDPAYPG